MSSGTFLIVVVAGVLGLMGWLGLPLDVATVMTASVVFGLAVDDTFHYLYHHHASGSIVTGSGRRKACCRTSSIARRWPGSVRQAAAWAVNLLLSQPNAGWRAGPISWRT